MISTKCIYWYSSNPSSSTQLSITLLLFSFSWHISLVKWKHVIYVIKFVCCVLSGLFLLLWRVMPPNQGEGTAHNTYCVASDRLHFCVPSVQSSLPLMKYFLKSRLQIGRLKPIISRWPWVFDWWISFSHDWGCHCIPFNLISCKITKVIFESLTT